jgi:hypothetical protein
VVMVMVIIPDGINDNIDLNSLSSRRDMCCVKTR